MPNRSSRRRSKPFVNPSERFAHERRPGGPEPLEIKLGGDTTRHYRDGKLHSTTTRPAAAPTAPPSAPKPSSGPPRRPSHLRRNVAIGVGATAAVGGGAYLVHRHRQRSKTVTKNLVDPFSEVVAFGKAYPRALPIPGARPVRAMIPTGRHVGDANALTHKKIRPRGHQQGPFSKGMPKFEGIGRAARTLGGQNKAFDNSQRVANGLKQAMGQSRGKIMPRTSPSGNAAVVPTHNMSGGPIGSRAATRSGFDRPVQSRVKGLSLTSPLRGTGSQTGSAGRRIA